MGAKQVLSCSAPHSAMRSQIIPRKKAKAPAESEAEAEAEAETESKARTPAERRSAMTWPLSHIPVLRGT